MVRYTFLRGVSAGALTLALVASNIAFAQETLPQIDIGADQAGAGGPASASEPAPTSALGSNPGGRITGYNATSATSALKMDTPILQTPVAVQVVTRETMDDQQAITVADSIMTNSSGVQPYASYTEEYKVRGFTTWPYRNGLQQFSTNYIDTANVQSIGVLKGPAAILYGRVEPGGIIDIVTKRPLETPYYSVQEQIGSYGLTRTTVDATGPLTADKSLLYRFNGDYYREELRSAISSNDRQVFLAPTISWRPIEQFKINVDFEYQHRVYVDDYPLFPAVGGAPAQIPGQPLFAAAGRALEPAERVRQEAHRLRLEMGLHARLEPNQSLELYEFGVQNGGYSRILWIQCGDRCHVHRGV